ncbi:MAG: TetR family transcriptional regulator [Deltaproteobacteria bacterium]|nr:TetR family transcriptional regulator [Deltaproteobacteria bacterium]
MVKDKNFSTPPRKALILQEAAHLFREKGYMASTLRELAKRSGVQGGSIYHYFSSKQEILYQIMDSTMASLLFNLKEIIRDEKDPVEKLKKAIRFHIEYHVKNPDETYVTDSEIRSITKGAYDRIVRKRRNYEKIFIQIIEEGITSGGIIVNDVKLVAIAILQMCTGVSHWFKEDGLLSVEEIVDEYINFSCWGLIGKTGK